MQKERGQKGPVCCGKRVKNITFVRIRRADPGFANGRGEKEASQLLCCIPLQLSQAKAMEKEGIYRQQCTRCTWVADWMCKANLRKGGASISDTLLNFISDMCKEHGREMWKDYLNLNGFWRGRTDGAGKSERRR